MDDSKSIKLGTCKICLDLIEHKHDHCDSAFVPVALNCGHLFHAGCLHAWIHKYTKVWTRQCIFNIKKIQALPDSTCPECRTEIKSNISRLILDNDEAFITNMTDEQKIEMLEARINSLKSLKDHLIQSREAEKLDIESKQMALEQKKSERAKCKARNDKRIKTLQAKTQALARTQRVSAQPLMRRKRGTSNLRRSLKNYKAGSGSLGLAHGLSLPVSMQSDLPSMVPNRLSVINLRNVPSRLAARAQTQIQTSSRCRSHQSVQLNQTSVQSSAIVADSHSDFDHSFQTHEQQGVSRQSYYFDDEFTPYVKRQKSVMIDSIRTSDRALRRNRSPDMRESSGSAGSTRTLRSRR